MEKPIIIETYKIEWANEFEQEKEKLVNLLPGKLISVEHIGSTAVPGLASKPIIDMAAGVEDLEKANEFIEPLKQIGYEFVHHEAFPERRFFRKGKWRAGTHHLHIYEFEGEAWEKQLMFRDYLRNHQVALKEYSLLKKELAELYRSDRGSYTQAKTAFIQSIIIKAQERDDHFS
ncbi:GrpB family protein [Bacillus testis]|uniref:GrpB family protein n=1 Tax=Bacillus testis TaxID=1622072 RepID=UPI00067ECA20|nr:GrpB family protein [Bacillus testis]